MEPNVRIVDYHAGVPFETNGGKVSSYEFYTARESFAQPVVRYLEVKGRNKAKRVEEFIKQAIKDNFNVYTYDSFRGNLRVVGLSD